MSLIYSSPVSTSDVYAGHAAQLAPADVATAHPPLKTLGITEEYFGYRTALSFFEV
jgi:hypothetical protein